MKRSAVLALLVFGVPLGAAAARTESVLHTFCSQANCTDGANPYGGVVLDERGNLYGTTESGGSPSDVCKGGCGVVYKVSPTGKETVLYNFCTQNNCTDGVLPLAGVVLDQKGNLYGTTYGGGAYGKGLVFKLTPKGKETVLYSFCAQDNCADGANPSAGVAFDEKGNLYGTTYYGGTNNYPTNCSTGCGVVFKLTPKGKETVLYTFCPQGDCASGADPQAGVVLDRKGNLYGTTYQGGQFWGGVAFKLTPKGEETVLYAFCPQFDCGSGAGPQAGMIFDQKGNLYGTTPGGGNVSGSGVAFKLTPQGTETVLYSFCAKYACDDGAVPVGGLVFDQKGNVYGTTLKGGNNYPTNCTYTGCGAVFKLTPEGKETVLYSFCAQSNCTDGSGPFAGVVLDQKGNLYGTTYYGGVTTIYNPGYGVVFKLTP